VNRHDFSKAHSLHRSPITLKNGKLDGINGELDFDAKVGIPRSSIVPLASFRALKVWNLA